MRFPFGLQNSTATPILAAELRIDVPIDCTRIDALAALLAQARGALAGRPSCLTLDLDRLRSMNCQLLSSVIYLARECLRAGVRFALENVPQEFDAWMVSHRLTELFPALRIDLRPAVQAG